MRSSLYTQTRVIDAVISNLVLEHTQLMLPNVKVYRNIYASLSFFLISYHVVVRQIYTCHSMRLCVMM